uniref:Uncharacterized protein n=1 Tax=Tanacetum cinerariifolium TaxID=118510 RepID=A0A699H3Q2_TANCI|nr:hypothetical protein [Tanacetum cinerariifolium]
MKRCKEMTRRMNWRKKIRMSTGIHYAEHVEKTTLKMNSGSAVIYVRGGSMGSAASYVFCMKAQEQDDSRFEGWRKDGSKDEDLITRISCNTRGVIGSGYRFVRFIRSG